MTIAVEDQNYDKSETSFQDLFLNKTKKLQLTECSVLEQLQSSTLLSWVYYIIPKIQHAQKILEF